jgi:hypoxanthine phosphoribosyltransferase
LNQDIAEVLLSRERIQKRVQELGAAISRDYRGKDLLMIGVLRGVLFFMADLLRAITIPVSVDFIAISRYGPSERTRGVVRLVKDLEEPIEKRHVIFVEDIVDTGFTLNYMLKLLRTRQPASLELCVLLDKPRLRLLDLDIAYKGFEIPDRFVVGYGLDYRQLYRNLPYIGVLKPEVYAGN